MTSVSILRYDTALSQQSVGLNSDIQTQSSYLSPMEDKTTTRKRKLTSHRLVEKRRRDRINKSLHELRDIIPKLTRTTQTFKNDKVELLQATIDYLNENGKKTQSQLRVTQHTLKGTQPTVNVTQHTLKGSQPPVNITQPTVNVTQPTVNVTQPTVNVTQPTLKVTQPIQDMTMCTQLTDVSNSTTEIASRSDGFRDCMEETIRYLIENEGFPSEHPVILRLRAHLQQRLELCGHNNGQTQLTNHTECISKTIPMIPHGSPAIPTGAVETSDRPLTDIMKPLTIDTRYQYAIPESISQHLTQDSQNNNSTLNRCLISNNSLLAVVPETNGYMNNNVQCNISANQQPSLLYPQQMHATNCSTVTRAGFNLNYVAPYVMAWVRPQQPNMAT